MNLSKANERKSRLFMLLIVVADDLYPRSVIIIEEKKMIFSARSLHTDDVRRKEIFSAINDLRRELISI